MARKYVKRALHYAGRKTDQFDTWLFRPGGGTPWVSNSQRRAARQGVESLFTPKKPKTVASLILGGATTGAVAGTLAAPKGRKKKSAVHGAIGGGAFGGGAGIAVGASSGFYGRGKRSGMSKRRRR